MRLIKQTLRSFSSRERWLAGLLFIVFVPSFYISFFGKGEQSFTQGNVYSEGLVGEIVRLNPVFTEFSEADKDVSSLIFSGLAKYNSFTGEFEEDLATHTLSEDKLIYTFTLKNNLFWHDGEEITADDIYFTFAEVIQAEDFDNPILKSNFEGVDIQQVDTRTVTFTLNSPNSFFFSGMTVGILPKHILEEVPVADLDTHDFNKQPIGSGPYQVTGPYEFRETESERGVKSVLLTRFDQYYGEIPQIENIRFVSYPTITGLVENRSVWHGAARIRESVLQEMDLENLVSYQYELPQYTALFLNTDSPNLSANKERLGVSKAIDKSAILDAIGYKVQIDTPLLELSQDEWIHVSDQKEAMGALFDAGWTLDDEAEYRTNENGERLSLRLIRRNFTGINELQEETSKQTAELIQSQLKEVGVEVLIESHELEAFQEAVQNRDYDMLLYGQSLGYNLDTFSYWHSSQVNEGGLNLSNYQNAKADVLIESIRASFDPEERQELLESLAEVIAEDVPAIFLYTPSYYYVLDTRVTGFEFKNILLPKDRFANIAGWNFN